MSRLVHSVASNAPVRRPRRGLSMVEAMVSLAITASLLTAAGAAFNASATVVQNNSDFNLAAQAARVTVDQMVSEIRQAQAVYCATSGATYFDVYRIPSRLTTSEVYRRFAYSSASSQVTLTIYYSNGTNSGAYTMASNVASATFGPPTGTGALAATAIQRLPVALTVTINQSSLTLKGSGTTRCELAS